MNNTKHEKSLTISLPEMYMDDAVMQYINDPETNVATWHRKGEKPGDYSDIFITYGGDGEGSHSTLPDPWWDRICEIVKAEGLEKEYVLLHIVNL